jgi:hypothetical protein
MSLKLNHQRSNLLIDNSVVEMPQYQCFLTHYHYFVKKYMVSSFKRDSHECIGCQELRIWNIGMDDAINYAIRPYKGV